MNTPLAYSIVPIAPSNSTSASGSTRRASAGEVMSASGETMVRGCAGAGTRWSDSRALRCRAHGVVLGLRVMHDHGGGALLRDQLERRGELHAERLLGGEQLEQLRVVLEVRARAVAPRVPLAASARYAELAADPAVQPLGYRLRALDGDAVLVE